MHVLLVTQYYWPESFIIDSLAKRLQELGHKVTVLTGKPNYPDGIIFPGYQRSGIMRETHDGVDIIRIPVLERGKAPRPGWRLALNYLSFVLSGLTLGKHAVRRIPYDVVFVYAPSPLTKAIPAILYARSRNAPLAVWVQDLWPDSLSATGMVQNDTILSLVERMVRFIYRHTNLILVQSRAFIEPVCRIGVDPSKVRYLPNFYKSPKQRDLSERARHIIEGLEQGFNIVFTGNIGTAQAPATIVDAAMHLLPYPEIQLYLVGSGSMGNWIAQRKEELKLHNLHLCGRVSPSDVPDILQAASALLTTLRSEPTFDMTVPSKVQAYLASGRPIVASMNGEGALIVTQAQAGLCSASGDGKALADNILKLSRMSPEKLAVMGDNGKAYFEKNFKLELLADNLSEALEDLIDNQSGR